MTIHIVFLLLLRFPLCQIKSYATRKEDIFPPVVNFINILCTAFMLVDPKSVKKIDNLTVFFTLLGIASVKAEHRT